MMNLDGFLRLVGFYVGDRRGVTSAEYAVLAVGLIVAVVGAVAAYDANNPMATAGAVLTDTLASFVSGSR